MKPRTKLFLLDIVLFALICIAGVLMATGCTTTGGAIQVKVPVPVACEETEPERPTMATDTLRRGANVEQFTKAARAELVQREGYEDRLRTVVRACIKPLKSGE